MAVAIRIIIIEYNAFLVIILKETLRSKVIYSYKFEFSHWKYLAMKC